MNSDLLIDKGIRFTYKDDTTAEYAWNTGKATADWLPTAGSVIVLYSPKVMKIAQAVTEGLRLQGRNVINGGIGDMAAAVAYIKTSGLSGAVVIEESDLDSSVIIRVYREDASVVDKYSGLQDIVSMLEAGNFVPATVKGELTALA